jgi:hypothetical protein
MNLQQLTELAKAGKIDALELISIEGGIYLLHIRQGGHIMPLGDGHGKTVHLRSVEHARQLLEALPVLPFHLVHACAHDEMCGLGAAAQAPLKVPIAMRSALYR